MAAGKLHVNGTTYNLAGDFGDRYDGQWQEVESKVRSLGSGGGNYASFSIRAGEVETELVVRSSGLAAIAAWLEEARPGRVLV